MRRGGGVCEGGEEGEFLRGERGGRESGRSWTDAICTIAITQEKEREGDYGRTLFVQ